MHIKASVFSLSWWWTQFPSHQISFSCCTHLMGSLNSSGCEFFIIWWCRQLIYLTIKNRRKKYLRIIIKAVFIFCIFLMPHHNLKNAVCDLWLEKFRVLSKQCLIHFYTFHVSLESFLTLKIRAFLWRKKNRNCQCCYWVCHKKKKERKGKESMTTKTTTTMDGEGERRFWNSLWDWKWK